MRRIALAVSLSLTGASAAPSTPPPTPAELAAFAESENDFALDLYARVRAQEGNIAISPFGISIAVATAWAGARGETAAQIGRALRARSTPESALRVAGHLVAGLQSPGRGSRLGMASRLFGERTYAFEDAYLELTRSVSGTPLERVDFERTADGSRARINAWVAGETQDRVEHLVPPGGVNGGTRLVLASAIYFLAPWATPFPRESTAPATFRPTMATVKDVPTMRLEASLGFAAAEGVKLLDLPYRGGQLAMTLLLPDEIDGLDEVEGRLSRGTLERWIAALRPTRVRASVPRFQVDSPGKLSLRETLRELGMPLVFDRERADLSSIARPRGPQDRLHLGEVFHRALVQVDEDGTEAAAGTAMLIIGRDFAAQQEFRADHPFLFVVRDLSSGAILFLGRVSDPAPAVAARSPFGAATRFDPSMPGASAAAGAIDPQLIRKVIREHAGEVRDCYERQLAIDPKLEGKVTIRWRIGPDGHASGPAVVARDTTLRDEGLQRCITAHIVTWEFPRPGGGGIAIVSYPWILRPGRR